MCELIIIINKNDCMTSYILHPPFLTMGYQTDMRMKIEEIYKFQPPLIYQKVIQNSLLIA